MKAINILISVLMASGSKPLLSENSWKAVRSNLKPKDDKKLSLAHQKLSKVSAYENIKAKACPENQMKWGFLKHLETGKIMIENDFGILPLKRQKIYHIVEDADQYSRPHDQREPFIRCLAQCYDLSHLLLPAVKCENVDLIEILLDADVKVKDEVKDFLETRNFHEETPLMKACVKADLALVRALIRLGCDVNVKNRNGMTNVHMAAVYDNAELLQILIENDADINAQNSRGQTALYCAGYLHNLCAVQTLVQNGAFSFAFSFCSSVYWHRNFSPHYFVIDTLEFLKQIFSEE